MKFLTSSIIVLTIATGNIFGQNNATLIKSFQENNSYSSDSCINKALKSIQPVKYYLVNSNGQQNLITLKNFSQLAFTKFYFVSEKPVPIKIDKEEKSQTKWDWLYFAGTAVAAVIVYLVWPDKSPESKQTLTFGKPLPPR